MPKIVRNPRVPDRIRVIDYREYAEGDEAQAHALTDWYENGDLIILSNYRFQAGRDVFSRISFPNKPKENKLILHADDPRHGEKPRPEEWAAARQALAKARITEAEFDDAVRQANEELFALSDRLFRTYAYSKRYCIYNFAEMLAHNMHFDSPEHAGNVTQLRVFVNVDDYPRIWRIGGTLEDMARNCYRSADLEKTMGEHARAFSRRTTLASFGDRYESGAHPYPMHSIAFQPGDVWFLNPNMLAHEVVYGRRILDGVFLFEPSGLRNPKRFYPEVIDGLHREQLGLMRYWWRKRKKAAAPAA